MYRHLRIFDQRKRVTRCAIGLSLALETSMSLIPRPTRRQLLIGGTALSGAAAFAGWHWWTGYGNCNKPMPVP